MKTLFDHFVGAGKQRRWQFEAKRLRRLRIDYQIEFGRLLNGNIGRFLTSQDLVNKAGGTLGA